MVFSSAEVTVGLSILFIMLLLASTALLDGVSRPRLSSSVTLTAGGRNRSRARRRSTLHGGPVVFRPDRATPCCVCDV